MASLKYVRYFVTRLASSIVTKAKDITHITVVFQFAEVHTPIHLNRTTRLAIYKAARIKGIRINRLQKALIISLNESLLTCAFNERIINNTPSQRYAAISRLLKSIYIAFPEED